MSLHRAWGILAAVLLAVVAIAPLTANDQSIDDTTRLLGMPLAECVSNPAAEAENRFKIELAGGRWHIRNEYHPINMDVFGTSIGYTRFVSPSWGINLHGDASYLMGRNAAMDVRGYGLETGIDAVFALGSAPSAAGPLNGSSFFVGFNAWISHLSGDYFQGVILGPNPKENIVIDSLTYQFRIGWQGRLWMKRAGTQVMFMEPAIYTYMNNNHHSFQLDPSGADDDVNPTSYGIAANLQFGIGGELLTPGDRLAFGAAGAWGFDHNNSYQFNIAYYFGAFNPPAGE